MSSSVELEPRYYIELGWYLEHDRSFMVLARTRLCPDCQERLPMNESSEEVVQEAIKDCCSKKPGFTSPRLPVLETMFRILLANGNEPMTVGEIRQRMREIRVDNFDPGPDVLTRLLDHDSYYGLSQLPLPVREEEEEVIETEEEDTEEVTESEVEAEGDVIDSE